MKTYESLFRNYKGQASGTIFAHFYPITLSPAAQPIGEDYDRPFAQIAALTIDGTSAWGFQQQRFKSKHSYSAVPKLKNYLNYTFKRLLEMEQSAPGLYFSVSADGKWISFNTGLQNPHCADLLAIFQRYESRPDSPPRPDWVYKGCYTPNESLYRNHFGTQVPDIASYSTDSRDFVFDASYRLEKDAFDHLLDRAKLRAGLPNATDEVVRTYLRGAIENLVPKIRRNYKVAIPVYYVEEKRMQLLLPFASVTEANNMSCFLIERDDSIKSYRLKTIFDLDQAYFSARLITRPDKDWLDP